MGGLRGTGKRRDGTKYLGPQGAETRPCKVSPGTSAYSVVMRIFRSYRVKGKCVLSVRLVYSLCLTVAGVSLGWMTGQLIWPREGVRVERRVDWRLYGEAFIGRKHLPPRMNSDVFKRVLSRVKDVSSFGASGSRFRTDLQLLPLACHPGHKGLFLNKYDKFLQTLADYSVFHKWGVAGDNQRVLVWRCDMSNYCGGLADRLKGIAYSLLLAMFSKRILLLSWGSGEQVYLRPNSINWDTDPDLWDPVLQYLYYQDDGDEDANDTNYSAYYDSDMVSLHMFSVLGGIGVDLNPEDLNETLAIINSLQPNKVVLTTNLEPSALLNKTKCAHQQWIADGLQQTGLASLSPEDLDNIVGIIFRYLFQITSQLLVEVGIARETLGLERQNYTGVHIRTGFAGLSQQESVKHPKLIRNPTDWEMILKCAVTTANDWLGPSSLLFLATDSPLVKHLAVTKYGGRFRSLDNALLHIDRMEKYPHDLLRNETEGTLSMWVDLILLAEAFALVRTDSGFALAAGQLCSLPQHRTVNGLHCKLKTS